MEQSILTSTKKILGLEATYTAYDLDIITHINSVFSTLNELGIGPVNGYMIGDAGDLWVDFLGATLKPSAVKTYVFLRVRLLFDPPATSFHTTALLEEVKQLEWRLNAQREATAWVDPNPVIIAP